MKFLILSALSGILLSLSFPKYNFEWLSWVALIPLFFCIYGSSPKKAAGCGFITGTVFYVTSLSWINNTLVNYGNIPMVISWLILLLLSVYLAFYISLFSYLVNLLSKGNAVYWFILAPLIWTGLEYIRSTHLEYGFSWQGLGYSQFQNLPIIQMAEFTGVYGISALIVLVNAGCFYILCPAISMEKPWDQYRLRVVTTTVLILAACLGFGYFSLDRSFHNLGSPLKVALIQGNIPQEMKWNPKYKNDVMEKYRDLTLASLKNKPDLIVWPEAVTPFYYERDEKGFLYISQIIKDTKTPLVFGSPFLKMKNQTPISYNSAYFLTPSSPKAKRYDKIHLVPFGEFIPFRKVLFFLDKMVEGIGDFGRGNAGVVFDFENLYKFGISICYEIAFPDLVRQPVSNGANFLVNITNDAWFGKSAASYQHISMAALRAVENRVPIVRAANTGITGAIDPWGRIVPTTDIFTEAYLVTSILPTTSGPTLYAQFGDIFCYLCLAFIPILAILAPKVPKKTY